MAQWDVLVVGGGHAGVEAALAAARRGARVGLVTFRADQLGMMSCNPAIGGIGKGHIVREVDACGGIIARAADAAGIHYRMLNRSKGTAVQGPRVQADRRRFAAAVQALVAAERRVEVIAGEAAGLVVDGRAVRGLQLVDGRQLRARAVVLATGTFLGGRMFCGEERTAGGRIGERAATELGEQLRRAGLPLAQLKTGTPPRLDGRMIDWARLATQPSDDAPWTLSPQSKGRPLPQLACAITRTTPASHAIIRGGLDRSPLAAGDIAGPGPRYCPSIEDKVVRFEDRDGHQIFLEPEGLDDPLVYPNGISTSLPRDVQAALVASIPGLERAEIVVPGYAVEYTHLDPRALDHRLASLDLAGLFCAGQINGTTGYEEAAGQGLVAGANAAAEALGLEPLLLDRASSYLGVMIDDLVLQGVTEPYRMLTARAEYRLRLRADNAETRLSPLAADLGLLSPAQIVRLDQNRKIRADAERFLATRVRAQHIRERGELAPYELDTRRGDEWLAMGVAPAAIAPALAAAPSDVMAELIEDARYRPYCERQDAEVARLRMADARPLPATLDFTTVLGLSNEMVERLTRARPTSFGAAARLRGVTPAALTAILLHLERRAA